MKKTTQDIERIITSGRVPEHGQFGADLLRYLVTRAESAPQPQSMFQKFFSPWLIAPLSVGLAIAGFVFLQNNSTPGAQDSTPTYSFSKAAFAASLESAFGLPTNSDTFQYRRIAFYNAASPKNSAISEFWQHKNNYRLDQYATSLYASEMNSAEELKLCVGLVVFKEPTEKYTPVRSTNCDEDLSANGFFYPNEHDTTATLEIDSSDPLMFNVILTTSKPISETDVWLSQIVGSYENFHAEPLNAFDKGRVTLNIKTNEVYTHILRFLDLSQSPIYNYPSPMIWYAQLVHNNTYSDIFEINVTTKTLRAANDVDDVHIVNFTEHIFKKAKTLFETTSLTSDPAIIEDTLYNDAPAVELTFTSENGEVFQFTQILSDKSIVEARVFNNIGDLLWQMTVEESVILLNQDPALFFTQEYWEAHVKNFTGIEGIYTNDATMVKQWLEDTNRKLSDVQK